MFRTVCFAVAILVCTAGLQAQSAQTSDTPSAESKGSGGDTLKGCLSASDNQFILTEDDGATHQLSGAAGKLGRQVGREVELTGKPGIRSVDTTLVSGASTIIEKPVFEVKTVKRIADTCK